jgi:nucleotide-binding universal stress UspA family protein
MKRIVIATDGSPTSDEAVEYGIAVAASEGAEVTFVHVVPPDQWVGGRGGVRPLPHHVDRESSDDGLAGARVAAEEAGVSYGEELISGDTVDEILAVADAKDADLIVVGSSGKGVVTSTLLGSVSRGVVAGAERPVLVVKGAKVGAETQ